MQMKQEDRKTQSKNEFGKEHVDKSNFAKYNF